MKIKTSELSGIALDWAVAKCELIQHLTSLGKTPNYEQCDSIALSKIRLGIGYSTDWAQGGPIIEREVISVVEEQGKDYVWFAWEKYAKNRNCTANGPTILITAMRCYVASKLGYEIDVPEELV